MSVKISVIIPIYNVSPYLRECLDSVLAQAYGDFEVICVDDASLDDSGSILDGYGAADARIKVIHKNEHAGTGEARNTGLAAASGEWLIFVDGDDIIAPYAFERLADAIDQSDKNVRLIRFGYAEFKHGEKFLWPASKKEMPVLVDITRKIKWEDFYVYMWEFACRRDVIGDVVFSSFRRGQDRVFINTIQLFNADSFLKMPDVLYGYRSRGGSSVHSLPTKEVLMDELSHRVVIVQAIDKSGKDIYYRDTHWLEHYCLREYLRIAEYSGNYTPEEQRELIGWFYHELPRICQAKGYSFIGKMTARLYCVSSGKKWRYLLSAVLPKLDDFLCVILNPQRVLRGIKRRLNGILH